MAIDQNLGPALALALASATWACTGDGPGADGSGPATADGHEHGDSSGPALDLGGGETSPGAGCTKVDLLFVIDDSHSMATEQGALVASFPEFIADIRATLDHVESYHVGVITTDAYAFNDPACRSLGALVTQTGGTSSSAAACGPFADGGFMSALEAIDGAFACTAAVGVEGSNDERPIQALLEAIGPAHRGGADDCNVGFVRDDALLVIVIITDEEDDHERVLDELHGSPGDPPDWFAAVEAALGSQQNAAILTIAGGHPDDACGLPKGVEAEDATRLRAFTAMFDNAFTGDVCAGNYGPFFSEAIAVVARACAEFPIVP